MLDDLHSWLPRTGSGWAVSEALAEQATSFERGRFTGSLVRLVGLFYWSRRAPLSCDLRDSAHRNSQRHPFDQDRHSTTKRAIIAVTPPPLSACAAHQSWNVCFHPSATKRYAITDSQVPSRSCTYSPDAQPTATRSPRHDDSTLHRAATAFRTRLRSRSQLLFQQFCLFL